MSPLLIVNVDCANKVAETLKRALESVMTSGQEVMLYGVDTISPESKFAPLVICRKKDAIVKKGYHVPDVFVFEQEKCQGSKFDNIYFWNVKAVKGRLDVYISNCSIDLSTLKDWCVGAFRIQLGLDEYCHGIQTWDPQKAPEQLRDRAKHIADSLVCSLFAEEITSASATESAAVSGFLEKIDPRGEQVRFLKPFGKLNALLFDDYDIQADDDWNAFFNIEKCIYVKEDGRKAKTDWLVEKLKGLGINRYMIDFILLDLCIGDDLNSDPTGYSFLPVLRQFYPLTPIIVYSSFNDMGHIARAFKEGATWYLRKEKKDKLCRHLLSIFSAPQWEREWNSIRAKWPQDLGEKLNDTQKYLITSTLKHLPGTITDIKTPSDGASSSWTFITDKGKGKAVVKIDAPANTKSEYERYQRFIRPYLDNNAGRIYEAPVIADYQTSAIAYTFAGSASTEIETFGELVGKAINGVVGIEKVCDVIDDLYDNLISQLHSVAISETDPDHRDYPNLFFYETGSRADAYVMKAPNENKYSACKISSDTAPGNESDDLFISRGIKHGKERVHFFAAPDLMPCEFSGDMIEAAGMFNLNPFMFRVTGLKKSECDDQPTLIKKLSGNFNNEVKQKNIPAAIIHGDLNIGNIMLEKDNGRIWLIDFATTRRDVPVIDYTVLYYSILRKMFLLLTEKDEIDWNRFNEFVLSSLAVSGLPETKLSKKQQNTLFILLHLTAKLYRSHREWLPAYQYGVAMSLLYGTRDLKKALEKTTLSQEKETVSVSLSKAAQAISDNLTASGQEQTSG